MKPIYIKDLNDFVGIPYADGKGGGLHCWELVQNVYGQLLGIELPPLDDVYAHTARCVLEGQRIRPLFEKINRPIDGCIVHAGNRRFMHHAGVYSMGRILHAERGVGAILESVAAFAQRYATMEYGVWRGCK